MNENIYQILVGDKYGVINLQTWVEGEKEAEKKLKELQEIFPNDNFWIEHGTDYITTKCNGCGTVHAVKRYDAYGIETGYWCDECYEGENYPYHKDLYFDPLFAGEHLEPENYF